MIKHNKPFLDDHDKSAVLKVMGSGYLSMGKEAGNFESSLVRYLGGSGQGVCVSSGTSALFLALHALKIKPGDRVIVPTYACSALLNAVNMIKAVPVPVDIEREDFNISYRAAKSAVSKKTKAIILVHMYGVPADIKRFSFLGIPVIEDCAQAIGAEYKNKKVGTFGDIAVFSFYATKLLTTGYGGMVYSRNNKYSDAVRDYVDFDLRRDYYPRFNFQMSDFQAALGSSQLDKLDYFLKRREVIAGKYFSAFSGSGLEFQRMNCPGKRAYYRFVTRLKRPDKMIAFLKRSGVQAIVPLESWELLHRYLGLQAKNFPAAEEISRSSLSLPVYPALKNNEQEAVITAVLKGLEHVR